MKTILVVDDNEDIGFIIQRILNKEGYEIILASNGDEALEKINTLSLKPDLVLLDIMMPGTPVAEIVNDLLNYKIIYISAVKISEVDKQNMISKDNIVGFIPKPFNREELIEIVKKSIGD
jgi:two-component system response regulator VicR